MKTNELLAKAEKKDSQEQITEKTVKVLANSIYQTLRDEGCKNKDIIGVSSQLIGLVTSALSEEDRNK